MSLSETSAANLAAWEALKDTIEAAYPKKQFVAIAGGKIVDDDADFMALESRLVAMGLGPHDVLVERVGDVLPRPNAFPGTLVLTALARSWANSETRTEG